MPNRFHRPLQRGFSLIELMVVVAVIAIIAAIALPNFQRAMKDTRRKSAHRAAIQLSNAVEMHAAMNELPPDHAGFPLRTLQPLVDSKSLSSGEALSLLQRFEGDQLDAYYTFNGSGWGFVSERAYIAYFRPEGEPDSYCYVWSKWGTCWYGDGTYELFTGDWW
jgi:prepilin-type N-terminal cleavage/methylation domain-containing protein